MLSALEICVVPCSVPPRAEGIYLFIVPGIVRRTHSNRAQRGLAVLLILSLRQMPGLGELLGRLCYLGSTAIIDHSLGSVYKKVKDLWVSHFSENFKAFDFRDLSSLNIYLSPLSHTPSSLKFSMHFLTPAFWINWHCRLCNLNKNIGQCSWAFLHGPVTLMSVKGQSHIFFLPWRINNVVILAEPGTSEPWAGSTLFSTLSSPKGPSSLVLFDSFIINVLQFCSPGQS